MRFTLMEIKSGASFHKQIYLAICMLKCHWHINFIVGKKSKLIKCLCGGEAEHSETRAVSPAARWRHGGRK